MENCPSWVAAREQDRKKGINLSCFSCLGIVECVGGLNFEPFEYLVDCVSFSDQVVLFLVDPQVLVGFLCQLKSYVWHRVILKDIGSIYIFVFWSG